MSTLMMFFMFLFSHILHSDSGVVGEEGVEEVELGAGEAEVIEEIFVAIEVMEVGANIRIETLFQEFFSYKFGAGTIVATQGHEVELEIITFIMEDLVVGFVHVHIALGMSDEGFETRLPDIQKDIMKVHRATHIRGLDKEVVVTQTEGSAMQLVAKGCVHHVFGSKMKLERTFIVRTEIIENLLEMIGSLMEVCHDMRGEPNFLIAYILHIIKEVKAIGDIGRAIVYTREDVAVDVGPTLEDA